MASVAITLEAATLSATGVNTGSGTCFQYRFFSRVLIGAREKSKIHCYRAMVELSRRERVVAGLLAGESRPSSSSVRPP